MHFRWKASHYITWTKPHFWASCTMWTRRDSLRRPLESWVDKETQARLSHLWDRGLYRYFSCLRALWWQIVLRPFETVWCIIIYIMWRVARKQFAPRRIVCAGLFCVIYLIYRCLTKNKFQLLWRNIFIILASLWAWLSAWRVLPLAVTTTPTDFYHRAGCAAATGRAAGEFCHLRSRSWRCQHRPAVCGSGEQVHRYFCRRECRNEV